MKSTHFKLGTDRNHGNFTIVPLLRKDDDDIHSALTFGGNDGALSLLNIHTQSITPIHQCDEPIRAVCVSDHVLFVGGADGSLWAFVPPSQEDLAVDWVSKLESSNGSNNAADMEQEDQLYTQGEQIQIDVTNPQIVVHGLPARTGGIRHLLMLPNRQLLVCAEDGVCIYNISNYFTGDEDKNDHNDDHDTMVPGNWSNVIPDAHNMCGMRYASYNTIRATLLLLDLDGTVSQWKYGLDGDDYSQVNVTLLQKHPNVAFKDVGDLNGSSYTVQCINAASILPLSSGNTKSLWWIVPSGEAIIKCSGDLSTKDTIEVQTGPGANISCVLKWDDDCILSANDRGNIYLTKFQKNESKSYELTCIQEGVTCMVKVQDEVWVVSERSSVERVNMREELDRIQKIIQQEEKAPQVVPKASEKQAKENGNEAKDEPSKEIEEDKEDESNFLKTRFIEDTAKEDDMENDEDEDEDEDPFAGLVDEDAASMSSTPAASAGGQIVTRDADGVDIGDDDDGISIGSHSTAISAIRTYSTATKRCVTQLYPGTSPLIDEAKILHWNIIGTLTAHYEEGNYRYDCEYADVLSHKAIKILHEVKFEFGCVTAQGIALAGGATIYFHGSRGQSWSQVLPHDERVVHLACSRACVNVVTTKGYLRCFGRLGGTQVLIAYVGPVFCMVGASQLVGNYGVHDLTLITTNGGLLCYETQLKSIRAFQVDITVDLNYVTWCGYSNEGFLCMFLRESSREVMLANLELSHLVPIVERSCEEYSYWPLGVRGEVLVGIPLHGSNEIHPHRRPLPTTLPLKLPVCKETPALHERHLRATLASTNEAHHEALDQLALSIIKTLSGPKLLEMAQRLNSVDALNVVEHLCMKRGENANIKRSVRALLEAKMQEEEESEEESDDEGDESEGDESEVEAEDEDERPMSQIQNSILLEDDGDHHNDDDTEISRVTPTIVREPLSPVRRIGNSRSNVNPFKKKSSPIKNYENGVNGRRTHAFVASPTPSPSKKKLKRQSTFGSRSVEFKRKGKTFI